MKISDKQKEEIYFLSQKFNKFEPTDKEISDYFGWVSDGKIMPDWKENRLVTARRHFDINLEMWRGDMNGNISTFKKCKKCGQLRDKRTERCPKCGEMEFILESQPLLFVNELLEDKNLDCSYLRKVLKETIKNLPNQSCKFQQAVSYLCQTTSTQ